MTTTPHPLTEPRAAELWDSMPRHLVAFEWEDMNAEEMSHALAAMRAAYDAGRAEADQDSRVKAWERIVAHPLFTTCYDTDDPLLDAMLAKLDTLHAVTTPTDPYYDPRPWQDCALKDIRKGDLVAARSYDGLRIGVAHHQGEDGDWWTEGDWLLTNGNHWPLRRIPAPTPPAEEVELPTEFGAVITDVEADFGEPFRFERMVWTGWRWTYKSCSTPSGYITAFTLPDGTRARRDGNYDDGTPRFVKTLDGEA